MELDQLKQLAKIDSLTGLYNRAYARRTLETLISKVELSQKYALLVFDIDFFKSANDEYGHLFGDQVLADVARRIQTNVRQSDICARIGGMNSDFYGIQGSAGADDRTDIPGA